MNALHIGVLALQGAFREHVQALEACGAKALELRRPLDAASPLRGLDALDGVILPGGESTVMGRLLRDWDLLDALAECGRQGLPIYGSCAGMILLCREIEGPEGELLDQPRLGLLDARVRRNAFGRQKDSFETSLRVKGLERELTAVFIRAPRIVAVGKGVDVLAEVRSGDSVFPVAVRQGNVAATSFHPELTEDRAFHRFFVEMCRKRKEALRS
ncbi:pyridoxal 5'-phosphate synthase glutaminase subunit PdxT [Mailhella sp.]|uniref:pyridoxal 5'-phosphate synthase glutaminase subunit PdxT n=1 Tax=Mailhella sp. TaxID=1981029 RepID=UPI004062F214